MSNTYLISSEALSQLLNQVPQHIYRYSCKQSDGVRYMYSMDSKAVDGWELDGISFAVPCKDTPGTVPVFEYIYNQSKTFGGFRHLYSASPARERQFWTWKGVKFYAYSRQKPNTVPVYEFMRLQTDGARFLLSTDEQVQGWKRNFVAFWAYPGELK